MGIKLSFTTDSDRNDYDDDGQGAPMVYDRNGRQLSRSRPAVTPERYVRRTTHTEVSTNDPAVRLQEAVKARTGVNVPAAVIAAVGGALLFKMTAGILEGFAQFGGIALACFFGYQFFKGQLGPGKGGQGGGDGR